MSMPRPVLSPASPTARPRRSRLARPVLAVLVAALALAAIARPAAAQGTERRLPDPMSLEAFEAQLAPLELGAAQLAFAARRHAAYLEGWEALRDGPIEDWLEAAPASSDWFTGVRIRPAGDDDAAAEEAPDHRARRLAAYVRERRAILRQVAALEQALFADLAEVLAPDQRDGLAACAARRARARVVAARTPVPPLHRASRWPSLSSLDPVAALDRARRDFVGLGEDADGQALAARFDQRRREAELELDRAFAAIDEGRDRLAVALVAVPRDEDAIARADERLDAAYARACRADRRLFDALRDELAPAAAPVVEELEAAWLRGRRGASGVPRDRTGPAVERWLEARTQAAVGEASAGGDSGDAAHDVSGDEEAAGPDADAEIAPETIDAVRALLAEHRRERRRLAWTLLDALGREGWPAASTGSFDGEIVVIGAGDEGAPTSPVADERRAITDLDERTRERFAALVGMPLDEGRRGPRIVRNVDADGNLRIEIEGGPDGAGGAVLTLPEGGGEANVMIAIEAPAAETDAPEAEGDDAPAAGSFVTEGGASITLHTVRVGGEGGEVDVMSSVVELIPPGGAAPSLPAPMTPSSLPLDALASDAQREAARAALEAYRAAWDEAFASTVRDARTTLREASWGRGDDPVEPGAAAGGYRRARGALEALDASLFDRLGDLAPEAAGALERARLRRRFAWWNGDGRRRRVVPGTAAIEERVDPWSVWENAVATADETPASVRDALDAWIAQAAAAGRDAWNAQLDGLVAGIDARREAMAEADGRSIFFAAEPPAPAYVAAEARRRSVARAGLAALREAADDEAWSRFEAAWIERAFPGLREVEGTTNAEAIEAALARAAALPLSASAREDLVSLRFEHAAAARDLRRRYAEAARRATESMGGHAGRSPMPETPAFEAMQAWRREAERFAFERADLDQRTLRRLRTLLGPRAAEAGLGGD